MAKKAIVRKIDQLICGDGDSVEEALFEKKKKSSKACKKSKADNPTGDSQVAEQNEDKPKDYEALFAVASKLLEACKLAEVNLSPVYSSDHIVMKLLRTSIDDAKLWGGFEDDDFEDDDDIDLTKVSHGGFAPRRGQTEPRQPD